MTPVAAYYVMVLTENDHRNETRGSLSAPSRPSLSARIAEALRARSRPSRPSRSSVAQPA